MTAEEFARFVDTPQRLAKLLRATAVITEELAPAGLLPVIVGGSAVEFYTRGAYTTVDIDLVVDGIREIDEVLRRLGFRRLAGASYVHPTAQLVVDLPKEPLSGDLARVTQVAVEGRTAYVIGLEDIVADRVRAAVYWQVLGSREWAIQLMAAHWESVDWGYLDQLATDEPKQFRQEMEASRRMAEAVVRASSGPDGL